MALFKDMLKKWFYTTGTNPELTATSRVPVLDDSGNAVGSTPLPNLGLKVIGDELLGLETQNITAQADLDSYITSGAFRSPNVTLTNGLTNKPSELSSAFIMYVFQTTTSLAYPIQIIVSYQGIFRRFKSSSSWSSWERMDTISAVFGADSTSMSNGDDLNNYLTPGAYRCAAASIAQTLSNTPYTNGGFHLYVFSAYNPTSPNTYPQQIVMSHSGIWGRSNNGSTRWSEWVEIAKFL